MTRATYLSSLELQDRAYLNGKPIIVLAKHQEPFIVELHFPLSGKIEFHTHDILVEKQL